MIQPRSQFFITNPTPTPHEGGEKDAEKKRKTRTKENRCLSSWVGVHLPLATGHGDVYEAAGVPVLKKTLLASLVSAGNIEMGSSGELGGRRRTRFSSRHDP